MLANRILFTTPCYPYPTLPANDSLTDATGQRFTKGDDIFTILSHTHCFSNHILAQNIKIPSVLLEYPRWKDFTKEIDKGYSIVGISAMPVHLDTIMKMCKYIRKSSPDTKILLGSYAGQAFEAQYDKEFQSQFVDQVVHGEGVSFMRNLLGEDPDQPISQKLMPKAGGSPLFLSRFPQGAVAFLISGLGCPGGCDFCSSTILFDKKRIEMLTPQDFVEHINLYHQHFPNVSHIFVIEEDHFRHPAYLDEVKTYFTSRPEVSEDLDWFSFGSIDYIGEFANKYGWESIAELGIGAIFIGVESKFAGEHGYEKRDEIDARTVFNKLHSMGIRTVGAWICGWDFHNHQNIYEDLNYFISLYPTYQQLTRLSPFPGTELWDKLKKEGRVKEVPWEDVHFWSGAQQNIALEDHETLNLTEYGYNLLYQTWGASLLRRLDVQLNGYKFCSKSDQTVLRCHRALFHKKQTSMFWCMTYAMDRFAPNGVVRRRIRKVQQKYQEIIGEPTPVMKMLAKSIDVLATGYKMKNLFDPINRNPKEEPFKRYTYSKNSNSEKAVPYTTEWPEKINLKTRLAMYREDMVYSVIETALKGIRFGAKSKSDPVIDDYLINLFDNKSFGYGF